MTLVKVIREKCVHFIDKKIKTAEYKIFGKIKEIKKQTKKNFMYLNIKMHRLSLILTHKYIIICILLKNQQHFINEILGRPDVSVRRGRGDSSRV